MVGFDLPVGAGAAFEDGLGVIHFIDAAEMLGILHDKTQQLIEQLWIRHDAAPAKVDEALVEAIALGAPAVFVDQQVGVSPPALVRYTQTEEHPQPASIERRDADAVL